MFFENDRTFCGNAECKHTECYRHQANIVGKPRFISIAMFEGSDECTKCKHKTNVQGGVTNAIHRNG